MMWARSFFLLRAGADPSNKVRNRRWRKESSYLCHAESIRTEINLEVGGKTLLDFAFETGNSELVAILIGFNATRGDLKDQWSLQDSLMEEGKQEIPEKVSELLRILVIGGTQFMGRQTVEELVAAGHEVTILSRGKSKNPHGEGKSFHTLPNCCNSL